MADIVITNYFFREKIAADNYFTAVGPINTLSQSSGGDGGFVPNKRRAIDRTKDGLAQLHIYMRRPT